MTEPIDMAEAVLRSRERAVARLVRAVRDACDLIELGDQRLLAGDGPAGGQPPALSLAEWRKLYVGLKGGLREAGILLSVPLDELTALRAAAPASEGGREVTEAMVARSHPVAPEVTDANDRQL